MRSVMGVRWPLGLTEYMHLRSEDSPKVDSKRGWSVPPEGSLSHCTPNESQCITSYEQLVELVAQIAGLNPHLQLYFRGERKIYPRSDGGPELYPTLWREYDNHRYSDIPFDERILTLKRNSKLLYQVYKDYKDCVPRILAFMKESPITQWALLQHYEICDTPLLDVTRSLRVASSFALLKPDGTYRQFGYVYVLGLPHQHETIMTSHDHGIVNVSLFGITPPSAKRPLRQKGYLTGSSDWWRLFSEWPNEYPLDKKVDLSARIVAVFKIENVNGFCGADADLKETELMSKEELLPSADSFRNYLKAAGFSFMNEG